MNFSDLGLEITHIGNRLVLLQHSYEMSDRDPRNVILFLFQEIGPEFHPRMETRKRAKLLQTHLEKILDYD